MPTPRPRLSPPRPPAETYLDYFGTIEYSDFCVPLGLEQLTYAAFEARTLEHGPGWWVRELKLEQINLYPPLEEYRMLVGEAYPDEVEGPSRFMHYIANAPQVNLVEIAGDDAEWLARARVYINHL